MGESEACLKKLKELVQGLDYKHRLIPLSMDGPNDNWKLLKLLQEHCIDNNPLAPYLFSIGFCGLHVLHVAFNTVQKSTGWQLKNSKKLLQHF